MGKRFVSYLRVSTTRQGASGLGLEAQRQAVGAYIEARGGQRIAEFVEVESASTSGRKDSLGRRPQLQAAIAEAKKAKAVLVFARVDRLTRAARLLHELLDAGVTLAFADLPEVDGPMGKFLISTMASVAELESGLIGARTKAAMTAAKTRAASEGRPSPFGENGRRLAAEYHADAKRRAGQLGVRLVTMRNAGQSMREMAASLTAEGIPAPKGGAWSATTVWRTMARVIESEGGSDPAPAASPRKAARTPAKVAG